jgi:hypothetical protein
MDCYWSSETADIVASQAEYSCPSMYKVTGAYWLDASGNWCPLRPTTPQQLDTISFSWRTDPATDTPIWIAFEGVNRFVLYPAPNFDRTGGLKFEGYANTNVSGISTWASDTSECPLPTWSHEAIWLAAAQDVAALMLAGDNPGEIGRAQRVMPILVDEARRSRGKAESAASTYHENIVCASRSPFWLYWAY